MSKQLTADDFRESLTSHVAAKGDELHAKYGPQIGWKELQRVLEDRSVVRYPCDIVFDSASLRPGEFAAPIPIGSSPEEGFNIHVHPLYYLQLPRVPFLVLYQLVAVNYGEFASAEDAETFGSHALGLPREEYYQILCELADQLDDPSPV